MFRELTNDELFFVCGGDDSDGGGGGGQGDNGGSGDYQTAALDLRDLAYQALQNIFTSTPLNVGEPEALQASRDAAARDAAANRGDTSQAPDGAETGGHA